MSLHPEGYLCPPWEHMGSSAVSVCSSVHYLLNLVPRVPLRERGRKEEDTGNEVVYRGVSGWMWKKALSEFVSYPRIQYMYKDHLISLPLEKCLKYVSENAYTGEENCGFDISRNYTNKNVKLFIAYFLQILMA